MQRRGTGINVAGSDPTIFTYANNGGNTPGDWYSLFMIGTADSGTGDTPSLYNGTTIVTSAGGIFTQDRWYHCAVTVNGTSGSNFLFYRDGALDITNTAVAHTAGVQTLYIGSDGATPNQWAQINVSQLKIYNRALSVAEINAEMRSPWPISTHGLNSAYPMPGAWEQPPPSRVMPKGKTTAWGDVSGNGSEWTESGTIDIEPGPPTRWPWSPSRVGAVIGGAAPTTRVRRFLDDGGKSGSRLVFA